MTLLTPWWLILIPPLLLAGWIFRFASYEDAWHKVIARAMLRRLRKSTPSNSSLLPVFLLAAGIALCLSNPVSKNEGQNDVFAASEVWWALVDLSDSMNEADVSPSRLSAARKTLDSLRESSEARALGLIVFSGDAFVAQPPAFDHKPFADFTRVLDSSLIPLRGSRPDRALSLALELQARQPAFSARFWLITDGDGITESTLMQAEKLRQAGHRLDIIHTALPGTTQPPGIDPEKISELARQGKGKVWPMDALANLQSNPFDRERLASESRSLSLQMGSHKHWSHWLILLCLLGSFLLLRRGYV